MIRNRINRPQSDRFGQAFRFRASRRRGRLHLSLGRGSVAVAVTWLAVLMVGTFAFLRTQWQPASEAPHPRRGAGTASAAVAPSPAPPVVLEVAPRPSDNAINPRIAGMNYLVLGSFARLEDARSLQHRVASLGILASIEPALPGWTRSGFCVVDERGFDLPREQRELDRVVARLKSARIDARPYRWRGEVASAAR